MALGEYRPPNQINNDEDKYWKFTKAQLLYGFIGLLIGLPMYLFATWLGPIVLRILAAVFALLFIIAGLAIGGLNIPDSKYLKGGGLRADKYIIRKLKKKYMKKYHVLYTKNIDRDKIVYYQPAVVTGDEKPSLMEDLKSMFGGN